MDRPGQGQAPGKALLSLGCGLCPGHEGGNFPIRAVDRGTGRWEGTARSCFGGRVRCPGSLHVSRAVGCCCCSQPKQVQAMGAPMARARRMSRTGH